MSRSSLLILLGILTILAPFSGLPFSWLHVIIPITGLMIMSIGFSIRLMQVRTAARDAMPAVPAEPEEVQSTVHHGVSPI